MKTCGSSGERRLAILFFMLFIIAVLVGLEHSVQAVQPVSPSPTADAASIRVIWQPGAMAPTNLQDLRLQDLENADGILRWVWGMEIPAGKKLVLHLHGGNSGSNPPRVDDYTYEVTGPLAASFGNRISLVRQVINQNQAEQLSLEIRTQQTDNSSLWKGNGVTIQIAADPAWDGERGSSGATEIPSTLWEQRLGPKDAPHQLSFQLDIAVAPADPTATPGQIVSPKK